MAQSRMMSIIVKKEKLEEDVSDIQKIVSALVKATKSVKRIPGGRKAKTDAAKNEVNPRDVQLLLQATHSIDNLILEIQNLLNRCTNHSFFLQRQLELRRCQM